jgi:SHS2 domain-containing protein
MQPTGFKFEDHTADVQVRSWGTTLEEAYEQTALSLMTTISPDLWKISPQIEKIIKVEAEDKEALLFDFLSEFLYIFDVHKLIFSDIKIKYIRKTKNGFELESIMKGERFNIEKHSYGTEVKAITYSYMEINEGKDTVEIKIIFDI